MHFDNFAFSCIYIFRFKHVQIRTSLQEHELEEQEMRSKAIDTKWVHRFLHKWQWSFQCSNTKGSYLADDSQEMQDMRASHRAQREINGVPWALTLNFDQVWRSSFEAPRTVLHKRNRENRRKQDVSAEIRPGDIVGKRLQTVAAIAKQSMQARMGLTEKSKLRKTVPRSEFVVGGRTPLTAVTSTWGNGEIGPLGVCVASGALPVAWIRELNALWRPHVFVFESGTESHFMNADTTMLYLQELIAPATLLI